MKYMIMMFGSQRDYDMFSGTATHAPTWSADDIATMHGFMEKWNGELVESGHSGWSAGNGGLNAERATRETATNTDIRPESDSASHGHDHCSVGTLAKNSVGLAPCTEVVTVMSEVALGGLDDCQFAYSRTILLSAPKTSPPHAAS